jgi:hypothetical protein
MNSSRWHIRRTMLRASACALLLLSACSSGDAQPAQLLNGGTPTAATSTTRVTATATPAPTPVPSPSPQPNYYTPPGWQPGEDVNCSDFKKHKQAQSFLIGTGGSASNDPYQLDSDSDGKACETLP